MENLFKYNPNEVIVALVDETLALSGSIMKAIDFRQPRVIEKLKLITNLKVGDYVLIDNYLFIVFRKHYRTKPNEKISKEIFEKVFSNITGNFKTTKEDHSNIIDIMLSVNPNIKICETSEWEY